MCIKDYNTHNKMNKFPLNLGVKNINYFSEYHYNDILLLFRESIYKHMISNKENDYFDLDKFCKTFCKNRSAVIQDMLKTIIPELELLGWKCQTSFGETGLFIYSTEDPPLSCHRDGF